MVLVNRENETAGLARWVLSWLRGLGVEQRKTERQLKLLETLSLGGKRQLMLVSCGDTQYLVGGGMESVTAIVSVAKDSNAEGLLDGSARL